MASGEPDLGKEYASMMEAGDSTTMARFATRVTGDDDALECRSVAYSFITVSLRNIVLASLARQWRSGLAVLCGCAQVDVGLRPQPRQLREGGRTQRCIHWYVCLLHASISINPALSFFECFGS
jgi:hypothetical protein